MRYTKRFLQVAMAMCLISPLALVMGPTGPSWIPVTGTYGGTFAGTVNRGSVTFEIARQDERRFMGMVTLVAEGTTFSLPFAFDGSQNSDDHGFNGVGDGMAGHLEFHGKLTPLPGGFLLIQASYHFISASGVVDEGTVTASNEPS
jgi:hypothetical protein